MARIRSIKPAFFTSEDISDVTIPARLLFIGLWTEADKLGRLEYRPKQIKARLFPHDVLMVEPLLDELEAAGLIQVYEDADALHGFNAIPTWDRHQRVHPKEPDSDIPPPPPFQKPGKKPASREKPGCIPSGPVGREGKGMEGDLGREGGGNDARPRSAIIQNPGVWSKLHSGHVTGFCTWMCLPQDDFSRFSSRLGGDDKAQAWAEAVKASGVVPVGKPWEFWNRRFDADFGGASGDADPHAVGGLYDQQIGLKPR